MTESYTNTFFSCHCWWHKNANGEGEKSEDDLLSAVLKDFQLPPVQFCSIKLGDGVLHVAARRELDHSVLRQTRGSGPGTTAGQSLTPTENKKNTLTLHFCWACERPQR